MCNCCGLFDLHQVGGGEGNRVWSLVCYCRLVSQFSYAESSSCHRDGLGMFGGRAGYYTGLTRNEGYELIIHVDVRLLDDEFQ